MRRILNPELISSIRVSREVEGLSLDEIKTKHGISRSTAASAIRGMDSSLVIRASPSRKVVPRTSVTPRPNLSKGDLGEAARQMILARLLFANIKVFRPITEDTPIDLLILRSDGVALKCQCKYAYPRGDGAHKMLTSSVRKSGPNSKAVVHRYTKNEVDFFLGYVLDNDSVYVIPFEELPTEKTKSVAIWVTRSPVGVNGGVSFGSEKFRNAFHLLNVPVSP